MTPGSLLGGRYLLEDRLGSGGMGEVWRCVDRRLDRTVAVKVLHPALAVDPTFRRRFAAEARTVAALRAPGVVRLYDACEDVDASGAVTLYLVMECVEGPSLAAVLDRYERLPPARTMRLVAAAAEALGAAHRAGIVHRDIKPANIVLGRDDEVIVLDFGIAHAGGDAGLTAPGMVMGTVWYASPEQLSDRPLTGLADVYSLGVVAYECLTGHPPFERSHPAAVMTAHLHEPPPMLPSSVHPGVAAVVMRALAKDPRDRHRHADEFARACRHAATLPEPSRVSANVHGRPAPRPSTVASPMPRPTVQVEAATVRADAATGHVDAATVASPMPRRRSRTGAAVIALAAVVAAAIVTGLVFWPDGDDPGGVAGPPPTGAASASESAPPAGPAAPGTDPTQIVNADTGECLDIGAVGFHLLDCDKALFQDFTFTAAPEEGVRFADEGGKCAGLLPESAGHVSRVAVDEDCTGSWRVDYLGTEDGWDMWAFTFFVAGRDRSECLTAVAEENRTGEEGEVLGKECDGTVAQRWRTQAG